MLFYLFKLDFKYFFMFCHPLESLELIKHGLRFQFTSRTFTNREKITNFGLSRKC